ncbi:MAG TPA: hypothetical protein VFD92_21140 [Candidatus Binatia bacterium]|nr:hypothetical protein [Candidatus Binatia bacterium]
MSSTARSLPRYLPPLLVLALVLAIPGRAHAVQAGGSLSLFPTNWGILPVGELIDVVVTANNTSTDTPAMVAPADGVAPVPAQLTGPITVKLACTDPLCNNQVSGKLAFVPVGPSGCVDKAAQVNSCSAAGPNAVTIDLKANGITIPPNGSVDLATIRLQVVNNDNISQLGLMAFTQPGALRACSSHVPNVCADCDASGCTTLVFGQRIITCPHACPERIIFRGGPQDPDFFEFHSLLIPGAPLDPPNQPFELHLSNQFFQEIFSVPQVVPVNGLNFVKQGDGTWTFRNDAARDNGGIAFIKISQRDGPGLAYKIDIQAFDPALEARATVPTMTVKFSIGPEDFETTNDWIQKQNGWLLNLP